MTNPAEQGMSTALGKKIQGFFGTLAPEEAEHMQRLAGKTLGQRGGHGLAATPAAGDPAGHGEQELPAPLADKMRQFVDSLSPDERSELQSVGQATPDEVRGYLGTIIPSMYKEAHNPTYGQAFNALVNAAGTGKYTPPPKT